MKKKAISLYTEIALLMGAFGSLGLAGDGTYKNPVIPEIGPADPSVIRYEGTYYLLYSGTGADSLDYAIGYATAQSPTGPFVKYLGNPIVQRGNGALGPGHGCVVRDDAQRLWSVYHQQKDGSRPWNRFICIDPLWFDAQGILHGRATRGVAQSAPVVTRSRTAKHPNPGDNN